GRQHSSPKTERNTMLWTTNVEKYSIGTELSASASRSTTSAAPMKNICAPARWIAARKGRPSIEISARTPALPEKTRSFRGFAEPNVTPRRGPKRSPAALATRNEPPPVAHPTNKMLPSESAETMLDERRLVARRAPAGAESALLEMWPAKPAECRFQTTASSQRDSRQGMPRSRRFRNPKLRHNPQPASAGAACHN